MIVFSRQFLGDTNTVGLYHGVNHSLQLVLASMASTSRQTMITLYIYQYHAIMSPWLSRWNNYSWFLIQYNKAKLSNISNVMPTLNTMNWNIMALDKIPLHPGVGMRFNMTHCNWLVILRVKTSSIFGLPNPIRCSIAHYTQSTYWAGIGTQRDTMSLAFEILHCKSPGSFRSNLWDTSGVSFH